MRYVNWGVVSRHSHAPILISLLLSNDLLHLFYRDCYSQNATVLLFFSPSFLPFHSFVRLTPTHQRDVYKGIVSHVRDETLLEYLILCAKICVLNILLFRSPNYFSADASNLQNKLYYLSSHTSTREFANIYIKFL